MKQITLTTDGACQPNPGQGGWAAILRFGSAVREITGSAPHTTNNVMELAAIVAGLRALKEPCAVTIRTDSRIAIAWCKAGTLAKIRRSEKRSAKLAHVIELIADYHAISTPHRIAFEWVRGHNGDPDNERCDALAQDICRRPF